jgi:hypothetical protein
MPIILILHSPCERRRHQNIRPLVAEASWTSRDIQTDPTTQTNAIGRSNYGRPLFRTLGLGTLVGLLGIRVTNVSPRIDFRRCRWCRTLLEPLIGFLGLGRAVASLLLHFLPLLELLLERDPLIGWRRRLRKSGNRQQAHDCRSC